MVERDYILRLIKQMTEALAIVFKLERGGDPHEALRVVDQTYQQLLGLDAATVSSLPPDALIALIRSSGAGYQGQQAVAERLTVLANLLQAEGDIYQHLEQADNSATRRLKALDIQLAILTGEDPTSERAASSVATLLERLDEYELPPRTKQLLWQHFEQMGDFARAENWMYEAIEDEHAPVGIVEQAIEFYQRLLERDDADLILGNLPRSEVEAGLQQLEAGRTGGQPVG
jgi:tetratricopeptide (TPR) repeat protein